jgi:hypothetical protein
MICRFRVEAAVAGDGLGEGVFRLGQGEAHRRAHQPLGVAPVQLHRRLSSPAHHGDDLLEQLGQLPEGGQRYVDHGDLLLQLERDVERGREEDQRRGGALQELGEIAHRPDDRGRIEVRVEVLEHDQRRLGELGDRLQRPARVSGLFDGRYGAAATRLPQASGDSPFIEAPSVSPGQILEDCLQPLLFPGDQIDQRVARSDEHVEIVDEARGCGSGRVRRSGGHVATIALPEAILVTPC